MAAVPPEHSLGKSSDRDFVLASCQLSTSPLVPELRIYMARDPRGIWQEAEIHAGLGPIEGRPFWAFAWPGGQALARFVLDNRGFVAGQRVVDLGAGSGLTALAALKAGARAAMGADIDRLAGVAMMENAKANGLDLAVTTEDLLAKPPVAADVVLVADLVYEPHLQTRVTAYLVAAHRAGQRILFADRETGVLPPLNWLTVGRYAAPAVPVLLDDSQPEPARVLLAV